MYNIILIRIWVTVQSNEVMVLYLILSPEPGYFLLGGKNNIYLTGKQTFQGQGASFHCP